MADNLALGVKVETQQALADLGVIKSAVRDAVKEWRAASDEFRRGGVDRTRLDQASAALAGLRAQERALEQQMRATSRAAAEQAAGFTRVGGEIRETTAEVGHFLHAAGLGIDAIKALRFGFAGFIGAELIRGFIEATKQINELNLAAKGAGTTVGSIKELQTSLRAAGDDAAKAAPMLAAFEKQVRAMRILETNRYWGMGRPGQEAFDPNKPFDWLGIRPTAYGRDEESQRRLRADTARRLLERSRMPGLEDQAGEISLKLYGRELEEIRPELEKMAQSAAKVVEPTKEAVYVTKQWNEILAEVAAKWEKVWNVIGLVGEALGVAVATGKDLQQVLTPPASGFRPYDEVMAETAKSSGFQPEGRAAGGYIRGPGSGTSDSILARLSNGEFVVNAASVRRVGVGFLSALNSFAEGGFVGMPPIPFANGGLAAASGGGTPIHLHIGSGVFPVSASGGVASALVAEARHGQMISAGTRPSWYGR